MGLGTEMRGVQIVTDSSACLPPSVLSGLPVRTVPVVIHLPTGDVMGDAGLTPRLVYQALARDEPIKSSAPSTLEYLSAIEEAAAPNVVVITPATEFTVMYRNASVAAELAGVSVTVVDPRTAAAAHGLVVLEACRAAAAGATVEHVAAVAEDASRRAELVAAIERLDFLRRSGRVPSVALGLAEHLGIRPVFRLHEGVVERLGVLRSDGAALRRICREAAARGLARGAPSAIFHADCPDRAMDLRALLGGSGFVAEFSPSMGIHTGPGVVGVAWLRPTAG